MDKLYIGIYGSVNSGKSSLINKLSGQHTAIVSPQRGTTTDPVKKLMELDGLGPCVLIDTAGIDDKTSLANERISKTMQTLDIVDIAVYVFNGGKVSAEDEKMLALIKSKKLPLLLVNNKSDLPDFKALGGEYSAALSFSTANAENAEVILNALNTLKPQAEKQILLDDKINKGDIVVLVCPIDSAAPKDRLILPQVKTIRNILDNRAVCVVLQPEELEDFLKLNLPVKLVITDSQAFKQVGKIVPPQIPLTSFSILFSRLKGNLPLYLKSINVIENLKDGDKILILESCNHSANTCDDIGRVKLPKLISAKSGKKLDFKVVAGLEPLPDDLTSYALAVQCGGCMITKNQLKQRVEKLIEAGVPVSNYGVVIAYCNGILPRVSEMF